jgi:glycosyltransferase involved in cell wall biosynthesis
MRVAQIIDSLKIGGAQKLQLTFAHAARQRNLSLTILSLREDFDTPIPEQLVELGVPALHFPARKLFSPSRMSALASYLRKEKFDVVQTHLTSANIVGPLVARMAGVPAIATLHSASFDPRHHGKGRRALESWALRFGASRVVAVGHVVAGVHKERLGGKPIEVIPNAVLPVEQITDSQREQLRGEISGDSARPLLLSVGRLSLPKGYNDLLSAFDLVRQTYPGCVLAIVGGGDLLESLSKQIHDLRLNGSAFLLGQRNDVQQLLCAADVYVSSSHWEGLPVSVLEAMSAGLPIAATNVGDLPHVVTAETGILVPPKDFRQLARAINRLLSSDSLRKSMGEAARKYVLKNHSPLAWIDRYIRLYEESTTNASVPMRQRVPDPVGQTQK